MFNMSLRLLIHIICCVVILTTCAAVPDDNGDKATEDKATDSPTLTISKPVESTTKTSEDKDPTSIATNGNSSKTLESTTTTSKGNDLLTSTNTSSSINTTKTSIENTTKASKGNDTLTSTNPPSINTTKTPKDNVIDPPKKTPTTAQPSTANKTTAASSTTANVTTEKPTTTEEEVTTAVSPTATTTAKTVPSVVPSVVPSGGKPICIDVGDERLCRCSEGFYVRNNSCQAMKTAYKAKIKITDMQYENDLADSNSEIFIKKAVSIEGSLFKVIKAKVPEAIAVTVTEMKNGSIVANFRIAIDDTTAKPNLTSRITEAIKNGSYGQYTIDKNFDPEVKLIPPPATTSPPTSPPTTAAPTTPVTPSGKKVILTEKSKTSTSITVTWNWTRAPGSDPALMLVLVINGDQVSLNSSAAALGEYTFNDREPYTNYTLISFEKLGSDEGPKSELIILTLEAAPSKPENVRNLERTKDTIEITWDPPTKLNGKIKTYRINYTFFGDTSPQYKDVDASVKQYTIDNLYPFVEYTINVQAKTVEFGAASSTNVTTKKGAPYKSPERVAVTNEVILNPNDVENVKVNVTIGWAPLEKHFWGDDTVYYTVSYEDTRGPRRPFGARRRRRSAPIVTTDTHVVFTLGVYKHITVNVLVQNTFVATAKSTKYYFTTKESKPSQVLSVDLTATKSSDSEDHFINVVWQEPSSTNGKTRKFKIIVGKKCDDMFGDKSDDMMRCFRSKGMFPRDEGIVQDFEGERSFKISDLSRYMRRRPLEAYTEYTVSVSEATCDRCWGDPSPEQSIKTKPGVPGTPREFRNNNIDSSSLDVSWREPPKKNGKLAFYEVQIYNGDGTQKVESQRLKPDVFSYKFENLEGATWYTIKIQALNDDEEGGYIYSSFRTFRIQTRESRVWLFILIGCLVVVLIVVLMLSIYLLVSRRRRQYKEVRGTDDMELTKTKSKVILLTHFKNYCAQQHANSDHGFQQEYELLKNPVRQFTWEYSSMTCNQSKNRYSNIVAYDHSRVILETVDDDPTSSYINANYIDGYLREKQYIATQGPLPETIIDFWRMIWDEKCPIIVMLTKLVEDNKLKCEQYWPEGKAMQYRDIVVTIMSVKEMTDMTVKVFKLHKINNPELGVRKVHHFHYTAWPDHGVPGHPTSMLSFIRHVMSSFPKELNAPILVHCSAGVGRTGTFIAIEGLLRQMEHHPQVDIYGTVLRMRMQRNLMVQTESQYIFIYDALLDNAVCGNTEISPENLVTRIKHLNEQDEQTGETHFMAEFKRLESGFRLKDKEQFLDASQPENKTKNRFLNILPFDKNRIKLSPIAGSRLSDYINASVIDGFQQKHAFIATQAPLENTVVDFWRMVSEQNVQIIVMLTKIEEKGQEKCYLYWPQAGMVSYGSIHVEVVNVRNQDDVYIIHDLRITNRESGKSWPVTHFLYLGWPEYQGSPDSGTDLIHFIGLVEKTQRSLTDAGPTLVHCSGGVGRTGVFITVFNSVERLKAKNKVDVFQTTRALRLQRSAMVQTIDQYKFCYQCLKDYLDSFDLYANPEC